jgi:DNA modification methylase
MDKMDCDIVRADFIDFLKSLRPNSVDLILTDPPYIISKKTGFKSLGENSVARFAVSMDFGKWDYTPIDLQELTQQSYRVLREGGTIIVFYDLWKITLLAEALKKADFNMSRLIIWEKTNPVPLNSKNNYLTNSREIAILGIKGGKPTFHSEYDNGVYKYPIPNHGKRYHPTQKPLELFSKLIEKHSNKNDLIVDPFLGSGTTAIASLQLGRKFTGCDMDNKYIKIAKRRIKNVQVDFIS